ncbi:MAG TPA: single-stranded DNA-binding protein [Acidimicrobiales bacterium]|nr:single-stranded DNA-binding protein [Acidimicrobiales bacterium]
MAGVATKLAATNVVALVGRLARPPEFKELPSGDRLVAYEVTVAREGERAEGVPVVWFGAPASAADHDVDDAVVVIGRVRRRFYRAGGATQSRTEVVADNVVAARGKRAAAALAAACARLEAAGSA